MTNTGETLQPEDPEEDREAVAAEGSDASLDDVDVPDYPPDLPTGELALVAAQVSLSHAVSVTERAEQQEERASRLAPDYGAAMLFSTASLPVWALARYGARDLNRFADELAEDADDVYDDKPLEVIVTNALLARGHTSELRAAAALDVVEPNVAVDGLLWRMKSIEQGLRHPRRIRIGDIHPIVALQTLALLPPTGVANRRATEIAHELGISLVLSTEQMPDPTEEADDSMRMGGIVLNTQQFLESIEPAPGIDIRDTVRSAVDTGQNMGLQLTRIQVSAGRQDAAPEQRKQSFEDLLAILEGVHTIGQTALGEVLAQGYLSWSQQLKEQQRGIQQAPDQEQHQDQEQTTITLPISFRASYSAVKAAYGGSMSRRQFLAAHRLAGRNIRGFLDSL